MKEISSLEICNRIKFENPWWEKNTIDLEKKSLRPRAYLELLLKLVGQKDPVRAVVLMGPRRVGKSVLLHHAIQAMLDGGKPSNTICYMSIDSPLYAGKSLDSLLHLFGTITSRERFDDCLIIFDEIQYLKGWETHLKKLVEDHPKAKFIASGSAAAALRLKSIESGAGRFSDFMLPPLTFHEFLLLTDKNELATQAKDPKNPGALESLNREFVNYLNYGGYPEAALSETIKSDPQRFIRSDIIDKVLLRDLPGLYGIEDIQELNRLFTMLAYNTGNEVSLENLSQGSGVAKNTIKRYLEYLEAAFLIVILNRVDQRGKLFKRANFFKVYLTNPSMRCALFDPVTTDHQAMGQLTETAVISQWLHSASFKSLYYSRWQKGEVDLVYHNGHNIDWCTEVKWTNRFFERPGELRPLARFCKENKIAAAPLVTTIDKTGKQTIDDVEIEFIPVSLHCYLLGYNTVFHNVRTWT
ncbi:MAG: ATP-binding protein [Elusimicrobia bacterium]|nr:ATP-binding protein [Elusimicrobiota bacterium]